MMTKRTFFAAATAAFALAAGAAGASTFTYDIERQFDRQWTGLGELSGTKAKRRHDRVYVTLDTNGAAGGGNVGHVEVGGYALNAEANNGGEAIGDFIGWCVDLFTSLQGSASSRYVNEAATHDSPTMGAFDDPTSRSLISEDRIDDVKDLFAYNYATLTRDNNDTSRDQLAGFQVAIWELLYEDAENAWNVNDGEFKLKWAYDGKLHNRRAGVSGFANEYLGNIGGDGVRTDYDFTFFSDVSLSSPSQTLITPTPPGGEEPPIIPLPLPAFLLLGGLAALGAVKRRAA